jgi:hypothetical protein
MSDDEYRRRIEHLVGILPDPAQGRATLRGLIAERVDDLIERESLLEAREQRDRTLAIRCAAFDATAAGTSRLRYEMAFERSLHASLRDLRACRKQRMTEAPTEAKLPETVASMEVTTLEAVAPTEANRGEGPSHSSGVGCVKLATSCPHSTTHREFGHSLVEAIAPTEANRAEIVALKDVPSIGGDAPTEANRRGETNPMGICSETNDRSRCTGVLLARSDSDERTGVEPSGSSFPEDGTADPIHASNHRCMNLDAEPRLSEQPVSRRAE